MARKKRLVTLKSHSCIQNLRVEVLPNSATSSWCGFLSITLLTPPTSDPLKMKEEDKDAAAFRLNKYSSGMS